MKSRIYEDKALIDYTQVNTFFEQRNSQGASHAAVMLCTPSEKDIAEKRNMQESFILNALLKDKKERKILDLGCGLGRWINNLKEKISIYTGVDFTKQFIEKAKKTYTREKNIQFYHSSVLDMPQCIFEQEYNLIIVNGLSPYLNDEDLPILFDNIKKGLGQKGNLYFRESVSTMNKRLTLKDFFSEKLQCKYNAIYRTPEEYEHLFAKELPSFSIEDSAYLLDETTGVQEETNQKYWFLHN